LNYRIDGKLNKILLGDPVRLNQILINLISNAVKFTHTGAIEIKCHAEKEHRSTCWVRIEVTDTGVGIAEEKLNTIFESFSQADASVTRRYGGTGLGLTIVKQLVELQQGTIHVVSKEHAGSTFMVTIPYGIGKVKDIAQTGPASDRAMKDMKRSDLHVLLVEDNDINRLYAKSILKNWECHIDVAENGLVAIEKIKNNSYDVVLMDIQMPVMDGYEATKAIRMMDQSADVPIIALTANATQIDVEKCLAAGMNDYLAKPFTPEDLYHKLFDELKITPVHREIKLPPPVPPAAAVSYNLDYLRSVSGNNAEFIREMVSTFIQTVPAILDDMILAMDSKDWMKLSRLAHQVKPSFTLMGLDALRSEILFLEENSRNGTNLAEVVRLAKEFIRKCRLVIPVLAKEAM
jgi:CheY-like chemotaxis protein